MKPDVVCERCHKNVDHGWYCSFVRGPLCDDCNIQWGIFETIVRPVMLGFGDHIKWYWKIREPNKLTVVKAHNPWEMGAFAV